MPIKSNTILTSLPNDQFPKIRYGRRNRITIDDFKKGGDK